MLLDKLLEIDTSSLIDTSLIEINDYHREEAKRALKVGCTWLARIHLSAIYYNEHFPNSIFSYNTPEYKRKREEFISTEIKYLERGLLCELS